ncbi:glycoside hydrolase family 88 protein [Clostridium sp. AL.422]|uniref:glycoside hydrolase family 88 protein n=1 Tax=Clostridium TaxID=1485 RepID=UPI00293DE336|nr:MULTISPECIES: glycoside hydrolase family 88 protein [unclassified Clostridium]MDV4149802.1 glycoside hydrolase family 88 protein [Clostridium sp. AL.422]
MNSNWKADALDFIIEKTKINNRKIGINFPHASHNGKYKLENEQWWTAGFWPGLLWKVYSHNEDAELRVTAEKCEEKMDHLLTDTECIDHDMGFMWTLTSLANYKLTGDKSSRRRALLAANLLAARFNPEGNYIRAWNRWIGKEDNSGVAIIDCLMNLPLLYWASEETGDPRFKHVAEKHVNMVLENFIREDGSVQHVVVFDSETGEVVEKLGGQGFAPNSSWARGCAWAVYGLTLSYKYTKDIKTLNAAKKTAHYFISNIQGNKCPVWDFRVPEDGDRRYRYLDSSAGAIAACGLLQLSKYVGEFEGYIYKKAGEDILETLYIECSSKDNLNEEGLIMHGTGHFPEQNNLDVPLIYGDYYFVEGISILNGNELLFW